MNIAALVALSLFSAVVGFAPMANASRIDKIDNAVSNHEKKANAHARGKGPIVSELAKTDGLASLRSESNHEKKAKLHNAQGSGKGKISGFNAPQPNGATHIQNGPVQTVAIPGTFLSFGVAFVALAVWHHRARRGSEHLHS